MPRMSTRTLMALIPAVVLLIAGVAIAQTGTTQTSTTQPPPPATQPAEPTEPAEPAERTTIADEVMRTRIAKFLSGEEALTLDDVKNPIFWFDTARDLVVTILKFIPRLLGTMIFLFVFWLLYRGIRKMVVGSMRRQEVDSSIRDLLGGLIKWAVMGFGIVIACNQLGIPIVAMLTGVSIIGLAVGFAAQETLANLIAGIVIFIDRPFKVGDWIEVGDQQGAVKRITFRSTRFVNLDNDMVVLPNSKILAEQIINKTSNDITRVNVPIGIAYHESIDKAREALLAAVAKDPRIEKRPEPEVVVRACAASSVDLMLHFWIKEERYQDAMMWEYTEVAKKALDAAGIEIPYPRTQLILEDSPGVRVLAGKTPAAR